MFAMEISSEFSIPTNLRANKICDANKRFFPGIQYAWDSE